jgi:adenosylhomocysteine nucleosidase
MESGELSNAARSAPGEIEKLLSVPRAGRLGIVAAFSRELAPLLRRLGGERLGNGCYAASLNARPIVAIVAGMGSENAYRAAFELHGAFGVASLLTLGFGGGLLPALAVGDLVEADEVIAMDSGERFRCQPSLLPTHDCRRGPLLSAQDVISTADEKQRLARDFGAIAVDMESAGVARAARQLRLPFAALKAITDTAGQSVAIDFQRCRSDDGTLSSWKILRAGLTDPKALRDLWRLAQGSRTAAENLALALAS